MPNNNSKYKSKLRTQLKPTVLLQKCRFGGGTPSLASLEHADEAFSPETTYELKCATETYYDVKHEERDGTNISFYVFKYSCYLLKKNLEMCFPIMFTAFSYCQRS